MKLPRMATLSAYGDSVGPLGLPMRSEAAFELEKALKTMQSDLRGMFKTLVDGREIENLVRRQTPGVMSFAEGERADISMVTTAAVDRDREIILPKGVDWSSFKKNPVVGYGHDYRVLPVGRAMWWARNKDVKEGDPSTDGWLAKTEYLARPTDWKGDWWIDAIWHMIKSKYLPGKSVGFIPMAGHPPTSDEVKRQPYFADARFVFDKIHIIEYSVVGVQANPDALVQAVAKSFDAGFKIPDSILSLMLDQNGPQLADKSFLDELIDDGVPEPEAPVALPSIKGCRIAAPDIDLNTVVSGAIERALGRQLI